MDINNLNEKSLEYIEDTLTNSLDNFHKFKRILENKDIYAIDIKKAKLKITKDILYYCKLKDYKIINNIIFLDNEKIPLKTKEELEKQRLENLKEELKKTEKKFFELNEEIKKLEGDINAN